MRVIAGVAKGRRLRAPDGEHTRPTADRVKEALFSSLQFELGGASVLDAYAGSGGLGIEALSRGAAHATFVEWAAGVTRTLRDNLEVTGLADRATVLERTVTGALADRRHLAGAPFNLALLDPPYQIDEAELTEVLAALVPVLAPAARLSLERARRSPAPVWPPGLLAEHTRRYGDTVLHAARAA